MKPTCKVSCRPPTERWAICGARLTQPYLSAGLFNPLRKGAKMDLIEKVARLFVAAWLVLKTVLDILKYIHNRK